MGRATAVAPLAALFALCAGAATAETLGPPPTPRIAQPPQDAVFGEDQEIPVEVAIGAGYVDAFLKEHPEGEINLFLVWSWCRRSPQPAEPEDCERSKVYEHDLKGSWKERYTSVFTRPWVEEAFPQRKPWVGHWKLEARVAARPEPDGGWLGSRGMATGRFRIVPRLESRSHSPPELR